MAPSVSWSVETDTHLGQVFDVEYGVLNASQ